MILSSERFVPIECATWGYRGSVTQFDGKHKKERCAKVLLVHLIHEVLLDLGCTKFCF